MVPTDFIWNHERRGQQSLSWSETQRLSVGLRVQVRQRVAGDGPRTDQNNDGKGVKRAEVPPAENFPGCPGGLPFCCLRPLVGPSVCLGLGLVLVWSFPVLGAGWRSRVPWPLPSWLDAAPVFLVPAPVLVFVRKGDVPRTDPVVPLPERAPFRYSLVCWQYWSVDIVGVFLRWYVWWVIPPPHIFVDFWQASPRALNPPAGAGGRASTCRAGSLWRFQVPLPSVLFCRPAPLRSFWYSYYLDRAQQNKVVVRDILGTLPVLGCRVLELVCSKLDVAASAPCRRDVASSEILVVDVKLRVVPCVFLV